MDPARIPPEQLASLVLLNVPPGAVGFTFHVGAFVFRVHPEARKGDAFVLLWVVNKQLCLFPRRLEGAWLLLTEPMFEFSRSARRQVEFRQVDKALNAKLVEQSEAPRHSKTMLEHNRVHGRTLVSVEGGDCSKRSNLLVLFFSRLVLSFLFVPVSFFFGSLLFLAQRCSIYSHVDSSALMSACRATTLRLFLHSFVCSPPKIPPYTQQSPLLISRRVLGLLPKLGI